MNLTNTHTCLCACENHGGPLAWRAFKFLTLVCCENCYLHNERFLSEWTEKGNSPTTARLDQTAVLARPPMKHSPNDDSFARDAAE